MAPGWGRWREWGTDRWNCGDRSNDPHRGSHVREERIPHPQLSDHRLILNVLRTPRLAIRLQRRFEDHGVLGRAAVLGDVQAGVVDLVPVELGRAAVCGVELADQASSQIWNAASTYRGLNATSMRRYLACWINRSRRRDHEIHRSEPGEVCREPAGGADLVDAAGGAYDRVALPRRLECDAHLQSALAAPRQIPQRPDDGAGRVAWGGGPWLHLARGNQGSVQPVHGPDLHRRCIG